ncbi:MAG TPA: hypothetical protein VIJ11_13495 [Galbitalea sp.]
MRIRRTALGIVVAAAVVGALAGCVQPSPTVIPTSVPSAKPVFASDADALAAAKKAYVAYLAVSDEILIDGGANANRLLKVATAAELKKQMPGFDAAQSKHWRSTGATQIDSITLQRVDETAPHGEGIVTVYACVDVSKVDVIDSSGSSVVSSTRPTASTFEATFNLVSRDPVRLILSDEEPWQGVGICP